MKLFKRKKELFKPMSTPSDTARAGAEKREIPVDNQGESLTGLNQQPGNPSNDLTEEEAIQQVDADHIKKLEDEVTQEKDKMLRFVAEFENYKKRNVRERTELIKTAGQEIILALLPVLDDFDRALKNVAGSDPTVKEGLVLIHHKLKSSLEQKGLSAMESIGKPFDTDLHEAITNRSAPDDMKGMVVDEAEKGYYLNGKVIRHAKVIVGN